MVGRFQPAGRARREALAAGEGRRLGLGDRLAVGAGELDVDGGVGDTAGQQAVVGSVDGVGHGLTHPNDAAVADDVQPQPVAGSARRILMCLCGWCRESERADRTHEYCRSHPSSH